MNMQVLNAQEDCSLVTDAIDAVTFVSKLIDGELVVKTFCL
jgi:hypothetical protein